MLQESIPITKPNGNGKAGLTVHLSGKDSNEPFEATVFFKKPTSNDEGNEENGIRLTASGKLTLSIGDKGFVEIFAENSRALQKAGTEREQQEEVDNVHLC